MSAKAEPWQTAEIAGPKKALLIMKPEVVAALIKKANRPILVVGHHATEEYSDDVKMIEYAIHLSKTAGIPMVVTAHTIKDYIKRNFQPSGSMSAMEIGSRLSDSEWKGLDGKGPYDLVLIMGLPYYMEFVILAGLKHFSANLKTISLDRFYNPHATWSFPNISVKNWSESFQVMLNKLGGE
jgi:acetyl-CoA decarbonylase/synthase complex subunit epsilon